MAFALTKSSVLAALFTFLSASVSLSHEVLPAIADMRQNEQVLSFEIRLSLEGIVAEIDLSNTFDTNDAPEAVRYDALRAMHAADFQTEALQFWPHMANKIYIAVDGVRVTPELDENGLIVPPDAIADQPRESTLRFSVQLPESAQEIIFSWEPRFGGIVLRQQGVEAPYTGFLENGAASESIALAGGGAQSGWQAFVSYIPVGFDHILPKGLDHILFVLGLFFLSTRMRPLIWQVSAFTLAHTITLALAALGWVKVPASIVEPLIAASITFIAIENIFTSGLSRTRPIVVFGFGLLHGLGFASVLGAFGLPENAFLPALIGFNIGVELGQLTVIAIAFALVGYWFGSKNWYRPVISIPASIAIAMMGGWWVIERTLL